MSKRRQKIKPTNLLAPKRKFIEVVIDEEGNFETRFLPPREEISTIMVGVAFASATRVISAALIDIMGLGKEHLEPIQEQIQKFYNDDLEIGSMGEEDNMRVVDFKSRLY